MIYWLSSPDEYPSSLTEELVTLNKAELPSGWQWVNSSPYANVATNADQTLFYKAFLPRNIWETPKAILRGSRCQRAIEQARQLPQLGFNTPAIVCWGKLNKGREYMVSEAVDGIGVGSCFASYFRQRKDQRSLHWKRLMIRSLGELVAKLHSAGIVHGDLRPNNVLLALKTQPFRFHLIDNERNKQYRTVPYKLIVKNLVQMGMLANIDISPTDRMRFLQSYLAHYPRFNQHQARKLAREVNTMTTNRLSTKLPDRLGSPDLPQEYLLNGFIYPIS